MCLEYVDDLNLSAKFRQLTILIQWFILSKGKIINNEHHKMIDLFYL